MQFDIESEVFGVAVEQFERTEEKVLNEFVSNRTAEGACLKIVKQRLFESIIVLGTSFKSLILYSNNLRQKKVANNLDILCFGHADC